MELTKLSPELIASNKTMKRRALKHCLIEYLMMEGYDTDDQGDHITFDNESTTKSSYNGKITDNITYTGPKILNIVPSTMAQYFFKMELNHNSI